MVVKSRQTLRVKRRVHNFGSPEWRELGFKRFNTGKCAICCGEIFRIDGRWFHENTFYETHKPVST